VHLTKLGGVLFLAFPVAAASTFPPNCLAGSGFGRSSNLFLTVGECSTIGDYKIEPEEKLATRETGFRAHKKEKH